MLPSAHAPGPPHHALRRHRPSHHRRHQPALPPRDGIGRRGACRGDRRTAAGGHPAAIAIDLVFDGVGHGVYGRLAQKMVVRYSGRRAADDMILDLVSEATMRGGGPAAADHVLVVTNDRGLRDHLRRRVSAARPWSSGSSASSTSRPRRRGHGVTPAGDRGGAATRHGRPGRQRAGDEDRRGWKPGRGATAKSGTPNKVARHKRHPRAPS